jgi:uncharacterized membrane protein YeaQ/YmgE (transglycosylase-associated protein family)
MSVIWFILFGFIVGLLARALIPGKQSMGLIMTTLLGIAGSFIGGFIAKLATGSPLDKLTPGGFIGSLLGALLVLGAYIAFTRRRHRAVA